MQSRTSTTVWREGAALLGFLVLCFAAAGIGQALAGRVPNEWYRSLVRPTFAPPSWVFGPVWTVLYAMMGVAGWFVWRQRGARRALAMMLFGIQLAFNAIWSGLFFGLQDPALAFVDIVLLWLAIAGTLWAFYRATPRAGWLLIPYFAWVTFAAVLNAEFWRLNP